MSFMTDRITITVALTLNELHQPVLEAPSSGRITLEVHDGTERDAMKHVRLAGSAEALRALGTMLLGMSHSAGHHVHFDESVDGKWFSCRQGFALTIENSDQPMRKEKRTSDREPPDWARG
jgi:hypothetical protein